MIKVLFLILFCFFNSMAFADDNILKNDSSQAIQEIQANDNKIVVVVQKVPINEAANQKVILKKNWLGVYIQINGKINPNSASYEVQ